MSANQPVRLAAIQPPPGASEQTEVLERLRDTVLGLLAGLDQAPPKSVRVRANDVELEVSWPEHGFVSPPAASSVPPLLGAWPAGSVLPAEHAGLNGAVADVQPVAAVEPLPSADTATWQYLTAHSVGVFYRASEPGAKPFAEVGDVITVGQQIGIIEAMKLMMPVEAERAGRVVEALVSDGSPVEYGDRLFAIEPAG